MPKRRRPRSQPESCLPPGKKIITQRHLQHQEGGPPHRRLEKDMSQDNGTTSTVSEMASRLRRDGQTQPGNGAMETHMRAASHEEGVGGPSSSSPTSTNYQLPQNAHQEVQRAQPAAAQLAAPSWCPGHIEPARPEEIERWILEGLQRRARSRGRTHIPEDLFDFAAKANVTFLDSNNHPVKFTRVVATWEDD